MNSVESSRKTTLKMVKIKDGSLFLENTDKRLS